MRRHNEEVKALEEVACHGHRHLDLSPEKAEPLGLDPDAAAGDTRHLPQPPGVPRDARRFGTLAAREPPPPLPN